MPPNSRSSAGRTYAARLTAVPLDVYGLFDRKAEGEWRIIGHQEDYIPEHAEDIWFYWGGGPQWKKSDVYGHTVIISEEECETLPSLSPSGDDDVRREVAEKLRERQARG